MDDVALSDSTWGKDPIASFSKNCNSTVGNIDIVFKSVTVFPNPINDIVNIEVLGNLNSIKLFNITGEMIKFFNPGKRQLNVSEFTSGIYFLEIWKYVPIQ